jgi:predicted phosphodiesterase
MVASVAVLSDIHGVLPALRAVLEEPLVAEAELIVVTGDHAAGPQPAEVLDLLVSLRDRVLLVRGNADRELVDLARGGVDETGDPIAAWAAAQLTPAHVALLDSLPHPATVEVDGFGPVVFCHGSPRDDNEVVLVDTRMERWIEVLADVPPEVRTIVGGHTHMPFARLVDRRQFIVSGSVGMPYGQPGAHWAYLTDGAVTLRRTIFESDAAVAEVVRDSTYPDREEWANYYLRAEAGDAEVIAQFGPRDGRQSVVG